MKFALVILAVITFSSAYGRIGMGESFFETPGGHAICDCDPYGNTPVLIGFEDKINLLDKWYFYHNNIVGQGKDYYFIFDETTEKLQYFKDRTEWTIAISQQDLEPLYTRWLRIGDSPEMLLFALFLNLIFLVPIMGIGLLALVAITMLKMWTKKVIILVSSVLIPIGLFFLYELNIHSF